MTPPASRQAPAAVLLGGGPIAVPVARTLSRAGARVIALGHISDPVRHSRGCDTFVDLGAGEGVQRRWLGWLSERRAPGAAVLPCTDEAVEMMARHRSRLVDMGYRPIELDGEVALLALDKHRTYVAAAELGIPAPRTELASGAQATLAAADRVGYPCALKPRHAHLFRRHFGLGQKLLVARGPDELRARLDQLAGLEIEMLVTEMIPGPDDAHHSYYSYLDPDGLPLVSLTKRKLRQYPPGFGLATYHLIHREEEVMRLGLAFFQGIGVRGVANVEFKRDARDGVLKLIECNHRFTLGHEAVRRAGIDLALLAYHRAVGWPDPPLRDYRTGVRLWHPVEDARTMILLRERGELTVRRWLRSLAHPQHFPLLDWRDPMPSLRPLAGLPARATRRAISRRAGAGAASSARPTRDEHGRGAEEQAGAHP